MILAKIKKWCWSMAGSKLTLSLFSITFFSLVMSCGILEKKEKQHEEPFRYPKINGEENPRNYTYDCEFNDRVSLSQVPDGYEKEFCPVNGVLLTVGGDAGYLDNCPFVRYTCDYDEYYGIVGLRYKLMKCIAPPSTGICRYNGWKLKHCFKFYDDDGRKCDCEYGEVICENH
jgi:hypothetical protein